MVIANSNILQWDQFFLNFFVPNAAGVYVLRDWLKRIIYIGKADSGRLRERLLEHWRERDVPGVFYFDWYQTSTGLEAQKLEILWIIRYNPPFNFKL